jgi:hypothetical protein
VTAYRTPWQSDPPPAKTLPALPTGAAAPRKRGRPPGALAQRGPADPTWLYHHLIVTGPAVAVAGFAAAARGSGVIQWLIDSAALEEDVFNLAASQPVAQRSLDIAGCRILARQFRDRVEARQARAAALVGHSRACPFDLHTLLPIPAAILQQGHTHPAALAWLTQHWGVSDALRQVTALSDPRPGRRLPRDHAVLGYGFFTRAPPPHAAVALLAPRWPALCLVLQPRPD